MTTGAAMVSGLYRIGRNDNILLNANVVDEYYIRAASDA